MEHVFNFQTQSLVAPRDPKEAALTPPKLRTGRLRRQILRHPPAEQQAFGHLHQFLKYEIYSDLAETPHGHVLTPTNPKTYDLIRQIYGEVVPEFPVLSSTSEPTKPPNLVWARRKPSPPSKAWAASTSNISRRSSRSCSRTTSNSCSGETCRQVSRAVVHSSQRHDRRSLGVQS